MSEIVLPVTTPETEWLGSRATQKVSLTRRHARLQLYLATVLSAWSRGRGEAGTEWRFRVMPPGESRRPLVSDLAFVAHEALMGFDDAELDAPPFAPTLAIEILSPDDRPADVAEKIDVLLQAGSRVVLVADPVLRTLDVHDGTGARRLRGDNVFAHPALPGLAFGVEAMFRRAFET